MADDLELSGFVIREQELVGLVGIVGGPVLILHEFGFVIAERQQRVDGGSHQFIFLAVDDDVQLLVESANGTFKDHTRGGDVDVGGVTGGVGVGGQGESGEQEQDGECELVHGPRFLDWVNRSI